MCIRRVWDAGESDLNLNLYRKIAKSVFQNLERVILYGFGEPFIHPEFIEIAKITRENLAKDSKVIVSTNGSALDSDLYEKILRIGVDDISFSIDTADITKLKYVREGVEPATFFSNLRSISRIKRRNKGSFKLGIGTVIMKNNFMDLPALIEKAAEEDVDYVIVSHVVPYSEEILRETAYITLSKKPCEIVNLWTRNYGRRIMRFMRHLEVFMILRLNLKPLKLLESFGRRRKRAATGLTSHSFSKRWRKSLLSRMSKKCSI